MEVWKDIKGYEKLYQVSNLGKVRSLDRLVVYKNGRKRLWHGVILKKMTQKTGYLTVNLSKNGKQDYFFVHHLVVLNFLDHTISRKKVIDHIDDDKENNTLKNFQIISHRENISKNRKNLYSKYTGVTFLKNRAGTKNWCANISINKKKKFLGNFYNEIEAHLAYQKELKNIKNV